MKTSIIECVPNFSEARRPEIVDAIAQAITAVPGAMILDRSSDTDHNRTVITIAGDPPAVEEAAFQAIKTASRLIDLNQHTGEHPRIGATDVVPFVPIRGAAMQDCVQIANRVAKRVGEELDIPVYLYEEAAVRPNRRNLEDIRRGEFEILKDEIKTNPDRTPDFGPSALGPAGATVIGARNPLIAFNAFLATSDVSIAKNIAKAIRHSSGGLRYVKALGMFVNGLAQISMNLTNYKMTPIPRVLEAIRTEASRYGTTIHHCELIGLIPEDALIDTAIWYSQLDGFSRDQVLELRLNEASQLEENSRGSFLHELASSSPTPGGGAAAAYCGALAASLAAMVGRITLLKKKFLPVHPEMEKIVASADSLRDTLVSLVEEDSKAYQEVLHANRLPRNTPEEEEYQQDRIQKALLKAAEIPLQIAHKALDTWELSLVLMEKGSLVALSDAGSSAAIARACFTGAHLNVQTNIKGLTDQKTVNDLENELQKLEVKKTEIGRDVVAILAERDNLRFI